MNKYCIFIQARMSSSRTPGKVLEDIEDATGENALKLLMMAYVRTEDELSQKHDPEGELFDEFRDRWGHWVNELLPLVDD